MTTRPSRRAVIQGGAAIASIAALGTRWLTDPAFAAGKIPVLRYNRDLQTLDPPNRVGPLEEMIYNCCSQNLARFKPNVLEYELDACSKLEQISETEIAFELMPGQMFTGGYGELTAEDVKFSIERFRQPGKEGKLPAFADDWIALDKVEVTGTYTGRILFKNPAPGIWMIGICDASGTLLSKKAYEALGDKVSTTLIGSGPYVIKEWKPNEAIILARNPDYKGTLKTQFDEIHIRPIVDTKTAELAVKAGEVHFSDIDPADMKDFEGDPNIEVKKLPAIDYTWLALNMEKGPLANIKVRQAIRLAVDVDAIMAGAYGGTAEPSRSLLAPGLMGYWKDAPLYRREVEKAKALLADAGQNGFAVTLTILNNPTDTATAQIIQANLAEVGITVTINTMDPGAYWAMGSDDKAKDVDMVIIQYLSKFDSSFQTQWFTSSQIGVWNWNRFRSPEFDQLHAKAASTNDKAAREAAFIRMQQLMDESASFVWITHGVNAIANARWLKPAYLPNVTNSQPQYFSEA